MPKKSLLLSSMSVVYVLTTPMHEDRGLILNGMSDSLFDIYQNVETFKEVWDTLEAIYMGEDASSKKFLDSNFTNYKMTDSRPVLGQYNKLPGVPQAQDNDKPKGNNVVGPSVVNMVEQRQLLQVGNLDNLKKDCHASIGCHKPMDQAQRFIKLHKYSEAYFVQDDDVAWCLTSEKLCMLNIVSNNIDSAFMSTSKLNDSILWHARVGHVHFKRMQDMSKDGLIPAFDMDTGKCKTCMLTKITKKPFQNVKCEIEVLELIHRLSQGFWGEAMLTTCYLLNKVSNKRNRITPYELWTKRKPNQNYLRIWGCREVVRLPDPKLKTLGKRGIECIFVGYVEHSTAFRFYVIKPNESVSINLIIESNDAIFDENRFSSVPRPSQRSMINGNEDIGVSVVP
ncbi:zinc finger, CCHC-type containing protein [Tanacetum coccineum]